jgi:hypothetical protein
MIVKESVMLFWPSWNKAFSIKNINSAWKSVGSYPWNPEIVLARFTKKEEEKPSSSESSQSILKTEDWRQRNFLSRLFRTFMIKKPRYCIIQ